MATSSSPALVRLAGGVVACDDEPRLARAVHSLLGSLLPETVEWSGIWVIVSPSRDRTVEVARGLAREDSRIHLIEETTRRGKSAALARLFRELEGDYAVLLNGDAEAEVSAIDRLLAIAPRSGGPSAVMARPIPEKTSDTVFGRSLSLLWELHHRFHLETIRSGRGTHVSDELLLVPLVSPPPLAEGIINDGAFIGSWVTREGGVLAYAPSAVVRIAVPSSPKELVDQRRRIRQGHRQVRRLTGRAPTTIDGQFLRDPALVARTLWSSMRGTRTPWYVLGFLIGLELTAAALGGTDRLLGTPDRAVWPRVRTNLLEVGPSAKEPFHAD